MLASHTVWRRRRAGEGARLQGRALWFHPVPHQKVFPTVYPLTCSHNSSRVGEVGVHSVGHWPLPPPSLPWLQPPDGAGLIYTSVKEEKNLDLLYKYIVHKVYDFQFTSSALVVEKDAVFMWVELTSRCSWCHLGREGKTNKISVVFFPLPVQLDGITRRKFQFCTKTSRRWDPKMRLRTSSPSRRSEK